MGYSRSIGLAFLSFTVLLHASFARAEEKLRTHVTIATEGDFPPWNHTNPDGTVGGYEIDLSKYLCAHMKVECDVVVEPFANMIPALNAGKFDAIMSALSVTEERLKTIAFSATYSSAGQTFATLATNPLSAMPLKGNILSLTTNEAGVEEAIKELTPLLKGKVLGVQTASTSARFAHTYLQDIVDIREYQKPEQHNLDLVSGRIDLVLASAPFLTIAATKEGNRGLVVAGPRFIGGIFGKGSGVGLRKEDTKLKALFDEAIVAAKKDGTMKSLSEKWFGFDVTPE